MPTPSPRGACDYEVCDDFGIGLAIGDDCYRVSAGMARRFAVLAAFTAIFIGLPVLSVASNFWFGEMPPHVHRYNHYDEDGQSVR